MKPAEHSVDLLRQHFRGDGSGRLFDLFGDIEFLGVEGCTVEQHYQQQGALEKVFHPGSLLFITKQRKLLPQFRDGSRSTAHDIVGWKSFPDHLEQDINESNYVLLLSVLAGVAAGATLPHQKLLLASSATSFAAQKDTAELGVKTVLDHGGGAAFHLKAELFPFFAEANEGLLVDLLRDAAGVDLLEFKLIIRHSSQCLFAARTIYKTVAFEIEQREDVADLLLGEDSCLEALLLFELESLD
ncbi:unnamed protein product [Sphagnum balticum]